MKKIVVTGGSGYIGQHFCKRIKETTDYEVIIIDNLSVGNFASKYCDSHYTLNISESEEVFKAHKDIDAVVHFAASCDVNESIKNPSKYFNNNTKETLSFLDLLVKYNVKNLIFSSTCTVFSNTDAKIFENMRRNPLNPYGLSKMFSEDMIKVYSSTYNINSTVLRYFNVVGVADDRGIGYDINDNKLIPAAIRAIFESQKLNVYTTLENHTHDNTCIRDYIHVEDLVDAHVLVLEDMLKSKKKSYDSYHLGRGEGNTTLEIIKQLEYKTGLKMKMELAGIREGDPPSLVADPRKFKQQFNWMPRRDMYKILESSIDWYILQRNKK